MSEYNVSIDKIINVADVYKKRLCCSCGICEAVCKRKAITYKYDKFGYFKPTIDNNECNNCGLCTRYCPGYNYFVKEDTSIINENHKFGYGYTINEELRYNAASGGLTTELLIYMLENQIVDYCVVVSAISNNDMLFSKVINNISDIKNSRTSKYYPINHSRAISYIMKSKKKFAIVALPCQISSLKRIFKNKQIFYISLFCNHCSSKNANDFIIHNLHINKTSNYVMHHRGLGWPGYIQINTSDKQYTMPFRPMYLKSFGNLFYNDRCRICNDAFGNEADISFGDAFLCTKEENKDGQTFAIIRSNLAKELISKLIKEHRICFTYENDIDKIKNAYPVLFKKTETLITNAKALEKFSINKTLPNGYKEIEMNSGYKVNNSTYKQFKLIVRNSLFKYISAHKFLWKIIFLLNKHKDEVTMTKTSNINNK